MKLTELFEMKDADGGRVIVIYPGRFHPPHPAHIQVYKTLVGKFGKNNVYISMTDTTNPETSPFSYDERKHIFVKMFGVPADKIIKVKRQYNSEDVVKVIDIKAKDALVFAVGDKDMQNNPRFKFTQESYVQNFSDNNGDVPLQPYTSHMYIMALPTQTFKATNSKANSATQVRQLFKQGSNSDKKNLFVNMYGKFDPVLFDIFRQKLI